MELSEITKVDLLSRVDDVNAYLALGWKILNTFTACFDTEGPACKHQALYFAMAWYGPNPQYPEKSTIPGITEF